MTSHAMSPLNSGEILPGTSQRAWLKKLSKVLCEMLRGQRTSCGLWNLHVALGDVLAERAFHTTKALRSQYTVKYSKDKRHLRVKVSDVATIHHSLLRNAVSALGINASISWFSDQQ